MIRVLQAIAGADHGGAEVFFTRLVPALQRAGVEQRAVIRTNSERAQALKTQGVEPVELSFGGPIDLITRLRLRREIRLFKPDIVMTWMNRATMMCPTGPFVHVARLGGYYDLKYYQACHHLIGNTEDIVSYVRNSGWPAERVHYLPNFASAERAPAISRTELYTPPRAPIILALGRLHENKAFDVLLKALARVPEAYLWLAGDGPKRAELETLAERLGVKPRVRMLGWRDDTAALFAAADIVICPSRHEPLGNVVIEAWAQGVPVIAADSLGPGTLIDNMTTGMLVPVEDAAALVHAIRQLLAEPELRARLIEAGRAVYAERFSEAVVVKKYIQFFETIRRPCAESPAS